MSDQIVYYTGIAWFDNFGILSWGRCIGDVCR